MDIRKGEDRWVRNLVNEVPTINVEILVRDSDVEDRERPPHDGEYVGTIEVVVLRCHHTNKQSIFGKETSSEDSSNGNERSTPGNFDGASDPQTESKSKRRSEHHSQVFGLDGGWDNWGPPPPPLDEPKMGRIEMTSENTGTWIPEGQVSKSSNTLEKTKQWSKRSESRDHFRSDFQKHGSPAGSQRGRSSQLRGTTEQEDTPQLNIRGGGPGSYSIASSEVMRTWNRGPPTLKEWAQEDPPSKGKGGLPAALDPWTANLPTGEFKSEAETKPRTGIRTWGTGNETRKKPGSKKGNRRSAASRSPNLVPGAWDEYNGQDQGKKGDSGRNDDRDHGNNGDAWGTSGNVGNGGDSWEGTRDTNDENHDKWHAGSNYVQKNNDDWAHKSSWDAQNKIENNNDSAWNLRDGTSDENKDDWGGNDDDAMRQNGKWGAADDKNPEPNDDWGATTGDDAQRENRWEDEIGQQTDTWGRDDTKKVTTGAKDPEKVNKPTGNQQAVSGEKAGSSFSFGNSRAKDPKLVSKAGSQGKPASVKSNKKNFTFDWLKPSTEKASDAPDPPVVMKKASVPGGRVSHVASPKQGESKNVAAQIPPTFSISTQPKPKPYWSTWRNPCAIAGAEIEQERAPSPEESEEPVYSIPAEVAQRNMMSHQVRPGRPAAYTHKKNKPKYMDTHENPYAVFCFKYRDTRILEHMLQTTIAEPEVDEKARLASLSKQELIDELVKTKSKLSVVESDSSGQATFVKKLDEKLSKLEAGKENNVPAVRDWVNTVTNPADGHGIANAEAWGTNNAQKGNGEGGSRNGKKTSTTNGRDKRGDRNSRDNADGNGGDSWGVNGDSNNANGKSDWNDNGNGEASSEEAEKSGNGVNNDWGTVKPDDSEDKKDDGGWGWRKENGNDGGDDWNNNNDDNDNNGGHTKDAGVWGNNNNDDDGAKGAGDWGNGHVDGNDQGGDDWDKDRIGEDGGWGGDNGKKDKGNGNDDTAFESSWEANTGGGGGGW